MVQPCMQALTTAPLLSFPHRSAAGAYGPAVPADLLDPEADQGLRQASAPAHHTPTPNFGRQAHPHITAPYLLITP